MDMIQQPSHIAPKQITMAIFLIYYARKKWSSICKSIENLVVSSDLSGSKETSGNKIDCLLPFGINMGSSWSAVALPKVNGIIFGNIDEKPPPYVLNIYYSGISYILTWLWHIWCAWREREREGERGGGGAETINTNLECLCYLASTCQVHILHAYKKHWTFKTFCVKLMFANNGQSESSYEPPELNEIKTLTHSNIWNTNLI